MSKPGQFLRWLPVVALAGLTACAPMAPTLEAERELPEGAEPYLTRLEEIEPVELAEGERLQVVATTSLLADVARQVGGDAIALTTLIPPGVDPHAFEPTPQDAVALAEADLIFINGFGLEEFMADLIEQAGGEALVVSASLGIEPLQPGAGHEGEEHEGAEHEHEGEAHEGEETEGDEDGHEHEAEAHEGEEHEGEGHEHSHAIDPHTWFDPNNVIHWTENIEAALALADPAHAEAYAANADGYRQQLRELDQEIRQALAAIPPERRKLVTDHEELGYFAEEYGFATVGAVIPSTSSMSEPSAQELTTLFDAIQAEGVSAIFVTSVANPALAQRLAEDAGVRLVKLYGHSLTDEQGPAPSYLALMRYNLEAIVEALAP
jgi:ABC-type Zn uptake system ZnuABC Zn-binding protein ZnuA